MHDILFTNKINKTDTCWLWIGAKRPNGYGAVRRNYKLLGAHRYSFELFKHPIPEGMVVCHKCDNRICVNPDHLWVGTQSDNMIDAYKKGRIVPGTPKKYATSAEQKKACWDRYYAKHGVAIQGRRREKRKQNMLD